MNENSVPRERSFQDSMSPWVSFGHPIVDHRRNHLRTAHKARPIMITPAPRNMASGEMRKAIRSSSTQDRDPKTGTNFGYFR